MPIIVLCCYYGTEAQSIPVHFMIRGTGFNHNSQRSFKVGEQTIYNAYGRGLRLTILNKSNLSIVSDGNYDTYISDAKADELAAALNNINAGQFGVLSSFDAWEPAVNQNLDDAFLRLGLTKAAATQNGGTRRPYAAIFEGATNGESSAKAVEVSYYQSSSQPFAEIRGYFHEGSFVASGTLPNALVRPQGDGAEVIVNYAGNVGIGTLNPGSYKLAVEGIIGAREVNVTSNSWADFVFNEDYVLTPLSKLEYYIKENKHLPDIPSEAYIKANGIDLGEMDAKLLQKIEELTLYMIGMKKEHKVLKERISLLEKKLTARGEAPAMPETTKKENQ